MIARPFFPILIAFGALVVPCMGQERPDSPTTPTAAEAAESAKVARAVEVPEPESPAAGPAAESGPAMEAAAAPEADVGTPSPALKPDATPAATEQDPPEDPPGDKAAGEAVAPAAPVVPQPVDWEKSITRVSILDDTRPITIPVETTPATANAQSKLPHVFSPYPPKPLSPVPEGWRLVTDPSAPARIHRVKLKDGRTLDLGVFPPALVPSDPNRAPLVFPPGEASPLQAIARARQAQQESRAKLQALLESMTAQLPAVEPVLPPAP